MLFRKARLPDAERLVELINHYAGQGLMLYRAVPAVYQRIRDYTVIEDGGRIIGVGGLHILWHDLAEICSLAIHADYKQNGLGFQMVQLLNREAEALGVERVFTLTYQPAFFEKCGFSRIDKEELPQKVWTECINCPKFPKCDEVALITKNF